MPVDQHNFMGTRTQECSDEKTNAVYQVELKSRLCPSEAKKPEAVVVAEPVEQVSRI